MVKGSIRLFEYKYGVIANLRNIQNTGCDHGNVLMIVIWSKSQNC